MDCILVLTDCILVHKDCNLVPMDYMECATVHIESDDSISTKTVYKVEQLRSLFYFVIINDVIGGNKKVCNEGFPMPRFQQTNYKRSLPDLNNRLTCSLR